MRIKAIYIPIVLLLLLSSCQPEKCNYLVTTKGVIEFRDDIYTQYIVKCECDKVPKGRITDITRRDIMEKYDKHDRASYNAPSETPTLMYVKIDSTRKLIRSEYDKLRAKKIRTLSY